MRGRDRLDGRRQCRRWFGRILPVVDVNGARRSHCEGIFTLFSFIAGLSAPRMSFWAAEVKSARPAIGRYSWFKFGSFRRISSA